MKKTFLLALATVLLTASSALAANIHWTDWTSATTGFPGSATGKIDSIIVNYTGDVTFAQLGVGENFWTEYFPKPYTGNAVISNAPTPAEMIALSGSNIVNTISFSQPINNPVMAIVSQGHYSWPVSYSFDQPFQVLSEGYGYFGDGWYTQMGNVLTGYELHGAIQFGNNVSSISWTANPDEYWHGITVGAVPEPATMLLLGSGLIGMIGLKKKSKS